MLLLLSRRVRIFFLAFLLGIFVLLPSAFASEDSFLFLKQKVQEDKALISLGYENQQHLLQKVEEDKNSLLFQLGNNNKIFLSRLIQEKNHFFALNDEIIFDVQKMLAIDIWSFLDNSQSREYGVAEYLLMTKASLEKAKERQQFLFDSGNALKENIAAQKKVVKNAEKQFKAVLTNPALGDIETVKQDLLTQSLQLKTMETDFVQKQTHYTLLTESTENLQKKITAVEENRDALIKNVKAQKDSGLFIGVVEDK
jgi:hypothetical protein